MTSKENQIKTGFNYFRVGSGEYVDVPRAIVAMTQDYPHGRNTPIHLHYRSQLIYASEGVMTVNTWKGTWVVPPLRAVWVPAFTEHQTVAPGNLSICTLFIKPEADLDLPHECCIVSIPPLMRELILHAVTIPLLYHLNSPEDHIMNVIIEQIKGLKIAPLDLPIPKNDRLKKIFMALSEDPSDNRTLGEWGDCVGATSRTLARLFKAETGISFRQFRQQIRILEALRRLGMNEPVTTIALDLGYESPSAFISMFKKALGKTPGQYFKG